MRRHAMAGVLLFVASVAAAADWKPASWAGADTIDLRTTAPGEGEHWFPVWVVVIDDQVYVRLGTRAASRVEKNTTAPYLGVKIAGQEFDRVKGVPAPDYVGKVAEAMHGKYWSDVLVQYMSHPMTLRLVPTEDGANPRP